MPARKRGDDFVADPFAERAEVHKLRLHALGGVFQFESNSPELLRIANSAYGGLPRHRLTPVIPTFRVGLMVHDGERSQRPPKLKMGSGAGFLYGATGSSMIVSPDERRALVLVDRKMLQFPYQTRYELIEFAAYMLLARCQGLVPLHAACVASGGRGALILGSSGAGKSTLALHSLLEGLEFLAEDSVLVVPETLLATGASTFVHVRANSLRLVSRRRDLEMIRSSPVIRRRSGIAKFEVDLRRRQFHLAPRPPKIHAIVLLSAQSAGEGEQLRPLGPSTVMKELRDGQPYACRQPGWNVFCRGATALPAFELRRGRHPRESVDAIRALLSAP